MRRRGAGIRWERDVWEATTIQCSWLDTVARLDVAKRPVAGRSIVEALLFPGRFLSLTTVRASAVGNRSRLGVRHGSRRGNRRGSGKRQSLVILQFMSFRGCGCWEVGAILWREQYVQTQTVVSNLWRPRCDFGSFHR